MVTEKGVKVTCFDHIHIATGHLESVHEFGCSFLSDEDGATPNFSRKSNIIMNFLDEKSGKTQNTKARLSSVSRLDGVWVYKIKWDSTPTIMK